MVEIDKKDEAVKVIVRCRPMNKREKDLNCTKCVDLDPNSGRVVIMKEEENLDTGKPFTFDAAFDTESNQVEVYQVSGQPLVEAVMDGYNGTIFAYGQTGCGKSFSMMGVPTDNELMGIIPRAFQQIFDTIASNDNPDKKFLVQGCYIEIYNEEVRDLLSSNHTARLDLKEHPEKGVYIHGVSHHTVSSVAEITKLMEQGTANRSVGATLMNADSSRSHSIFIVQVETSQPSEAGEIIRQGVLNLVDLAGSERQGKTGATGQRLKEAAKINLSLSALGNVISALVAGKTHIPYRDSKLTRLLQNSLGGNAKTVMLAAISPAHDNYEETLSTLRYANRAKNIKNKPKINEDPRDAMLREYQEEIQRLRELLSQSGIEATNTGTGSGAGAGTGIEGEKVKMIKQAKEEMNKLSLESKVGEEESKYMQQQLQMETAEQQARLQALDAQRKEVEAMREEILRKEQELNAREQHGQLDVDHEAAKRQLAEERAMLEEEIMRERDTQVALEAALREKEEESERMRVQLAREQEEREKRQRELQEKLTVLEQENNAARKELERKLAMMEDKLMLGGAKAQEDKDAAIQRLTKMKKERERSEKARKELELEAKRLQGQVMQGQQQQSQQNEEIRWLREQLSMLNSEMDDLRDEFSTEKADSAKTIKELSKELMLYKAIVRTSMEPETLRAAMTAARYDERSGKWIMGGNGYGNSGGMGTGMTMRPHMPAPPSGPNSGATSIRARIYQQRTGSGPGIGGGFGKTSGIADTEAISPQPADQRADNGWKRSIRGEFTAMPPPGPGISRTKTGRSPIPEVDVNDIVNLPRRPGFKPNMTEPESGLSGPKPNSRNSSRQELSLEQMRPRPGFVPAGPPVPSPRTPTVKEDATDLLSFIPRRPGFQPAGAPL